MPTDQYGKPADARQAGHHREKSTDSAAKTRNDGGAIQRGPVDGPDAPPAATDPAGIEWPLDENQKAYLADMLGSVNHVDRRPEPGQQ